jgi:hypothetical protein
MILRRKCDRRGEATRMDDYNEGGGRLWQVAAAMTPTTLNPLKGLLLPPSCPMPMPVGDKAVI